ncbi:MAG: transcription initiation factor TFIIIB [Clostridia bacterium]
MQDKECPKCGCKEIGSGKLSGYASVQPVGKMFSMGSEIIASICTECGYILEMKVLHPEKFKGTK